MSLKSKLARLDSVGPVSRTVAAEPGTTTNIPAAPPGRLAAALTPPRGESERQARMALLRQRLADLGNGKRPGRGRAGAGTRVPTPAVTPTGAPGVLRATEHGEIQIIEMLLAPEHRHGDVPVSTALAADPAHIAALCVDSALATVNVERLLLIDTETTGLSGGAGTLPFLIGTAWFDADALRVEQLFLRQPGEETPMLRRFADRLAAAECLVTYNGKSFDWPLLRNRYVMNRLQVPEPPPHIDLLHCGRRVLKRRLRGMRLSTLETEVLGYERVGDIDGALIPQRYFDYLRGADGACLDAVVEHNADDLIALAAILGWLAARFAGVTDGDDARDRLALAELALRVKDDARALAFSRAAAKGGRDDLTTAEALVLSARLHKRHDDARAAVQCLHDALPLAHASAELTSQIHLGLAKLYEHQMRDAASALSHAEQCRDAEAPDAGVRRLARLHRRADQAGEGATNEK